MTADPAEDEFSLDEDSEQHTNKSFAIVGLKESETIEKLFNGETEVEKSGGSNWSVSGGDTVVLKIAYLSTLPAETYKFNVLTSEAETVTFEIVVTPAPEEDPPETE